VYSLSSFKSAVNQTNSKAHKFISSEKLWWAT